jgi:hypothetical protein
MVTFLHGTVCALPQWKHCDRDCEVFAIAILAHSHFRPLTLLDVKIAVALIPPELPDEDMTHLKKNLVVMCVIGGGSRWVVKP